MAELEVFRVGCSAVSAKRFDGSVTVNGDAEILKEHFPDFPIVPGACIVGFVTECITQMRQTVLGAFTLQRIAFLAPIVPGLVLSLVIDKRPGDPLNEGESYSFRIHHKAINYCRGVITVEGEGL